MVPPAASPTSSSSPLPPAPPPLDCPPPPPAAEPIDDWLADLSRAIMQSDDESSLGLGLGLNGAFPVDSDGQQGLGSSAVAAGIGDDLSANYLKSDCLESKTNFVGVKEEYVSPISDISQLVGDFSMKAEVFGASEAFGLDKGDGLAPNRNSNKGESLGGAETEHEDDEEEDDECGDEDEASSSTDNDEKSEESEEEETGSDGDEGSDDDPMNLIGDSVRVDLEAIESDEEGEVVKGPIKSKHEIEVLPPVPKIDVQLEPSHQLIPVGKISAIIGEKVVVHGVEKHTPLDSGSILWITECRTPLGFVDEPLAQVKEPYYLVRYNSDQELPEGIRVGTPVSYVMEFVVHIFNLKDLRSKGYDASGEHDEEVADEFEFSDDEKEAEFRRSLRQAKRQADERQNKPIRPRKQKDWQSRGGHQSFAANNRVHHNPTLSMPMPKVESFAHRAISSNVTFSSMPAVPMPKVESLAHSTVSNNATFSSEAENVPMGLWPMLGPALAPGMPDPSLFSAIQLAAAQLVGGLANPSQLLPQSNQVGLSPQPAWNHTVAPDGAFTASLLQNFLAGMNQYQQQLQNHNLANVQNAFRMPQQQQPFFPGAVGEPIGQMLGTAFSNGPGPSPLVRGNFGQVPHGVTGNSQGQEAPPGQQQFNPFTFAGQGNSTQVLHGSSAGDMTERESPYNGQPFQQFLQNRAQQPPQMQFNARPASSSRGRARFHRRGRRNLS